MMMGTTMTTHAEQEWVNREVAPANAGKITGQPAFLRGVRALRKANDSDDRYRYPRPANTGRAVVPVRSMGRTAPLP